MTIDEPKPESDAVLLLAASQGSHAAFETIYLRHAQAVLTFISRRCQSLDPGAAEDMVSETFLRMWRDRLKLALVVNCRAYLIGISKNLIARMFRTPRPNQSQLPPGLRSTAPSPDALLERKDFGNEVNQALALLAPSNRLAIQLSQQGLSAKQIASIMGCTEKGAQRRLEKTRAELRLRLPDIHPFL